MHVIANEGSAVHLYLNARFLLLCTRLPESDVAHNGFLQNLFIILYHLHIIMFTYDSDTCKYLMILVLTVVRGTSSLLLYLFFNQLGWNVPKQMN